MSVFTIYCHGTGGHRDKPDDEIVAFMGRRAIGSEYSNYLILDGVAGRTQWVIGGGIGKGGFGKRDFAKNLDQYTQSSAYFVNEHHRVLLETLCPTLYRWLFTMGDATQGLAGRAVGSSHPAGRESGAAV